MTDYILLGDIKSNDFSTPRDLILEVYETNITINHGYKTMGRGRLIYRGKIEIPSTQERTVLRSADSGTEKRKRKTPFESLRKSLGINYTSSGGHITFDYKGTNTSNIVIKSPILNKVKKLTETLYKLRGDKVAPMVRR